MFTASFDVEAAAHLNEQKSIMWIEILLHSFMVIGKTYKISYYAQYTHVIRRKGMYAVNYEF